MIGAIIGDIVGSRFEFVEDDDRDKNFIFWGSNCRATDDTFMTLAVAKALFLAKGDKEKLKGNVAFCLRSVAKDHPNTGWGEMFYRWLFKESKVCSIGGDSDTIGAMAGGIAEAYYGVPPEMEEKALSYLSDDLQGLYHAFGLIRKERKAR